MSELDFVCLDYNFVCVDVETTGLDDKKCEVIEVTAAEYNLNGQVGRIISKLCRPVAGFIPAEATAVNHITWEMVKDSPNYLSDGVREEIAEFIGTRTATGHNIISFDSKFLKIKLDKVVDTLNECRKRFSGSNKLKTACLRINIDWDDKAAHRSEYDVLQTIKLHCKINVLDEKERVRRAELPLFSADAHVKEIMSQESKLIKELVDIDDSNTVKLGILPSENDRKMMITQSYSYSRVNLFNQCPFKWYMQYIKGFKEPNKTYFQTGKICHKVAEWAGEWCYKQTFKNKLCEFLKFTNFHLTDDIIKSTKQDIKNIHDFCEFIYNNLNMICVCLPTMKNVADLIYTIDHTIKEDSYDHPSMPDLDTYNKMIEKAISYYNCNDADVITESRSIMGRFYSLKDFSIMPGELILMEKKLVFDREWNPLDDFNSNKAFFRGIIDLISYLNYYVIITDYKSSRKMMSLKELKEDRQTMAYVLLICKFLPKGSFNKIIVRVDYIRFGQTVEYEISDPEEVANQALEWINSSIQNIEKEMLKTDGTAFNPTRNEYCHTCFLGEEGVCPLFNKQISGKLDDPFACAVSTIEECRAAWKRIETNNAENKRLTNLCKSFVKQCEDPIKIDENAKLDFWAARYREYDTKNTVLLLLNKKFEMTSFINYFNISGSNLATFLEEKGIVLTKEELDSISKEKTKMMFEAFTQDEAKGKGFINA